MSQPVRTCVGCGAKQAKAALARLVVREGKAVLAAGGEPGRGAYLCGVACLRKALDRRALPRAFRRHAAVDEALAAQLAGRH